MSSSVVSGLPIFFRSNRTPDDTECFFENRSDTSSIYNIEAKSIYSDGNSLTFVTEKDATADVDNMGETVWGWGVPAEDEQAAIVPDETIEAPYIGNRNSKKLHYADCPSVDDMKDKNKVEFYSRDEAINQGYEPCKRCNP